MHGSGGCPPPLPGDPPGPLGLGCPFPPQPRCAPSRSCVDTTPHPPLPPTLSLERQRDPRPGGGRGDRLLPGSSPAPFLIVPISSSAAKLLTAPRTPARDAVFGGGGLICGFAHPPRNRLVPGVLWSPPAHTTCAVPAACRAALCILCLASGSSWDLNPNPSAPEAQEKRLFYTVFKACCLPLSLTSGVSAGVSGLAGSPGS